MIDASKIKIGDCTEDDSREIPEYIMNMTHEEREEAIERLYNEMKANPQKRPKVDLGFKTVLDD